MLSTNIQARRKAQGLSQDELAMKVHVVRQTVSKWERGLSIPDAEMLIALADALKTSVSELLGAPIDETEASSLVALSEKLEIINLQLARNQETRRRNTQYLFIAICVLTLIGLICFALLESSYLTWDYRDAETAVAGTFLHGFEWLFVRIAPFALIGSIVGIVMTRSRKS
ncbi:helix-turn-helix domain-containing protein [Collinsella sp. zg1085]|uniref:helix-turn-helix domain-containing protein n=1 Tax=Collinsella sp. zg1085 TaxID=2844380 RepID=UPI001C0E234C|nr:helix-turn-helix transcriptional regulator [Collinsella sp. zg1085]QWT17654.1 helix-turn-helix domain-containing protein [Collinsella sp. zg1085]